MNKEEFIKELNNLGISPDNKTMQKLDKYYHFLVEENQKYNLTAITGEEEVYLKHFYDSLTIIKMVDLKEQYILDIGTGAGFPGIVLKIFFSEIKIDLLDATTKKCEFLKKLIVLLDLKNISVINDRAENYAKENREKYDIVVSRAVAPLKHLLEYSIPTLKIKGLFISLKGNITKEKDNIENYYHKLSLTNEKIINFELPKEQGFRTIYKIEKFQKTNTIYPRQYSQIKKKDI